MSTLESTISMLEALPEDDLIAINGIVKQFFVKIDTPSYEAMSKNQMIEALKMAQEHAKTGSLIEGHEFAKKMREKYAL